MLSILSSIRAFFVRFTHSFVGKPEYHTCDGCHRTDKTVKRRFVGVYTYACPPCFARNALIRVNSDQ